MIAQANFTLRKLGFREKSYDRKTAKMVGLNSARNNYNINANLATLRCCLIKLKAQLLPDLSWLEIIERSQVETAFAYQIISNHRLK